MQRIAQIVRLRPQEKARYEELHAAVWPDVLRTIADCRITNYSIFLREPELLLFAYFEYLGDDLAADRARMAADSATQEWWAITMPQQQPLDSVTDGEWWAPTREVFHVD